MDDLEAQESKPWVAVVCWLLNVPANMLVYLRDGSAQTVVRTATMRLKLQIRFSLSSSHSILTPGQPVPALTRPKTGGEGGGGVATGVPVFKSPVGLDPEKIPREAR